MKASVRPKVLGLGARLVAVIDAATKAPDPASRSLLAYAAAQLPGYQTPHHIRTLASKLEAVERGEIKRLMIFEPPRHGKSALSSQLFPGYYLGRHPDREIICASYAQDLADDFGRKVRNLVMSDVHGQIFPGSRISADSSAAKRFDLTARGTYFAVGRGAAVTGRGADVLLIDDPIKDREEADSETVRRTLKSWYGEVAYTRLQPNAAVVIVQTRWHQDDLAGWLLAEHADEGWDVLSLPAIAEKDEQFRREGDALWPERFPLDALWRIKAQLGSAAFAALYQQRPAAAEGAIFKRAWWGRYSEVPRSFLRIVQSWDTAFRTSQQNDYSACTTWGETATGYYLLHAWRGRVDPPSVVAMVQKLAADFRPEAILVEENHTSGASLIQTLKLVTKLPVLGVRVTTDKVSRANAVTPTIEAGKVFIPAAADWLTDWIDDLSQFPSGTHDDYTDTTTMALEWLRDSYYGEPDDENEPAVRYQERRSTWL